MVLEVKLVKIPSNTQRVDLCSSSFEHPKQCGVQLRPLNFPNTKNQETK
jgi:hypothetical protein